MDPVLPFACPSCGMRSVAVGICPDCRLDLVAQAVAPKAPPEVPDLPAVRPVLEEFRDGAERAAHLLQLAGIPASLVPSEKPSRLLLMVPEGWEERAARTLSEAWDRDAERMGLDPVTEEKALALEAEGLCPACGDPLLPEGKDCPSCGIALA